MADNQPMEKPVLNQPVGQQVQTQTGPSQTGQVPPSPSAISPPGPKFVPPKLPKVAVLSLAVGLVVLVVLGILAWRQGQQPPKSQPQESPPAPPAILSSPNPNVRPPKLPTAEGEKAKTLMSYFKVASPNNFKESFMSQVPALAYDEYSKFVDTSDPAVKLQAARSFYIVLNNPAVDRSDPSFERFLADVKANLEKQLGRRLI